VSDDGRVEPAVNAMAGPVALKWSAAAADHGCTASEKRMPRTGVPQVLRKDPFGAREEGDPASGRRACPADQGGPSGQAEADDGWSWPPYAPVEDDDDSSDTSEWAPSSVVWHPHLRLGRWTVVYRR
jgi:hypothetical protein